MESGGGEGRPPFGDDERDERPLPWEQDAPSYEEGSAYETGEAPAPPSPPETGDQVVPRPEAQQVPPHRRPPRRGRRHRDLPAAVRRRQAIAVIVIVLVVVVGIIALFSGGGSSSSTPSQIPLPKLVGQTVVGKLGKGGPDKNTLKRVRAGEIGGFVVFPAKNGNNLKSQVAKLQQAASDGGNPPLMIAIDQEGGPVKRLKGPPTVAPKALGESGDTDTAKQQGQQTAEFLSGFGVNVDLAPVADVSHAGTPSTIKERTFGSDPANVAKLVVAFSDGLKDGGNAATVKHFPGLGLASENTDTSAVTIPADRGILETDEAPFSAAIDAGVPLVMMSTAKYPGLGSKDPAAWSQPIIQDDLRQRLSFNGVVITDDLESAAATDVLSPEKAAVRSLAAGADMVMFATGLGTSQAAYKSLVKAAEKGTLTRTQLEDAYGRITDLKDTFSTN
jgi:beta-N-acetylhexosaminidase